MAFWHRLGVAVGITALVGCGNPTPDHPVSGHTTGSTDAGVSPSAGDAARAGSAANKSARQAPTQTAPLGPTAQQALTPGALITSDPEATSPAHDARVQTAASPADTPPPNEQTTADQALRAARQRWFAEVRESPDVTVRLQALEVWAQQPGDTLDPVSYALVDGDEHVRARAQELWEQQLTRETATTQPVQQEGHAGQTQQ
jgi:hypothetical protein